MVRTTDPLSSWPEFVSAKQVAARLDVSEQHPPVDRGRQTHIRAARWYPVHPRSEGLHRGVPAETDH